jgi:hypothetical protein
MPGKGAFKRCVEKVRARGGAYSARGVCAAAARRKYGERELERMQAAGRRKKNSPGSDLNALLDELTSYWPTGSALKSIESQREKLQRKLDRETKGSANKNARQVRVNRARRKANPRNPVASAEARYEAFHGRPSEELIEISTPMHEHSVVAGIGELRKLVVISPEGQKVIVEKFGFNQAGQPALLTMNEAATQLFIDGGDQSVNLQDFGILAPYREWETLGQVKDVYYFTTKDHLGADGGTATYHHRFGGMGEYTGKGGRTVRKRSRLPDLIYDTRNKLLYFSGGGYTLPDEGIAN